MAILRNASRSGSDLVCSAHMPKAVWTELISYGESISRRIPRFPSVGTVWALSLGAANVADGDGKKNRDLPRSSLAPQGGGARAGFRVFGEAPPFPALSQARRARYRRTASREGKREFERPRTDIPFSAPWIMTCSMSTVAPLDRSAPHSSRAAHAGVGNARIRELRSSWGRRSCLGRQPMRSRCELHDGEPMPKHCRDDGRERYGRRSADSQLHTLRKSTERILRSQQY